MYDKGFHVRRDTDPTLSTGAELLHACSGEEPRWALGIRYPWLEQAYAAAYSAVSTQPNFQILSQWGTLPPEIASQIVQQFLMSPLVHMFPPQDKSWTMNGSLYPALAATSTQNG